MNNSLFIARNLLVFTAVQTVVPTLWILSLNPAAMSGLKLPLADLTLLSNLLGLVWLVFIYKSSRASKQRYLALASVIYLLVSISSLLLMLYFRYGEETLTNSNLDLVYLAQLPGYIGIWICGLITFNYLRLLVLSRHSANL